jgi:hypothetical protein
MDFTQALANLNWLAVFVAALSTFVIGGIWYSPLLFVNSWMAANKLKTDDLKGSNQLVVFGVSFILAFIMSLNLALFIGTSASISFAIMASALTAIGWILPAMGIIALFEKRSLAYFLINGGYMLVSFIVMGLIIGVWK